MSVRHTTKKSKRKIKRRLAYLYMPIFFGLLIFCLAFVACSPFVDTVTGALSAISGESVDTSVESIYTEPTINGETVDNSVIKVPSVGQQYAKLTCKRLGINAPIIFGDNDECLANGVGHHTGTLMPGFGSTILLAGHNYSYFKPFKNVVVGDVFKIKTSYGTYKYKCTKLDYKEYDDPKFVDYSMDEETLVMYTCYPFYYMSGIKTQRLLVICEKVSGPVVVGWEASDGE